MKYSLLTFCLFIALMVSMQTGQAQCNATFTISQVSTTDYEFQANQVQLPGYTYYQYWAEDGYEDTYNYTSTELFYYYQSGTHSVCHYITVQDSDGVTLCFDSSCQTFNVIIPPHCVNMSYTNATVDSNKTVTFSSNISNYTNLQITWSFGDGTSVNGIASPTHTYAQYGEYFYCLYAIDTVQHCGDSICDLVGVDSAYDTCNLWGYLQAVQPSLASTGANLMETQITSYFNDQFVFIWNFGDGTSLTTTADSTVHIFPAFGSYNIFVTDSDITNHCSYLDQYSITLDTCTPGFAQFFIEPTTNVPFTADFSTDSAADGGYYYYYLINASYLWTFGDGTSSAIDTFQHTYAEAGTYNTCLTFTAPGCDAYQSCNPVTVGCNLDASFTYNVITSNTISFSPNMLTGYDYDEVIDSNASFLWVFGDSATSTEDYPTHVFDNTADLNTCLIVTDQIYGCSDTFCTFVVTNPFNDTVCGVVFLDLNSNGIQDPGEPGIPNFTVYCNAFSDSLFEQLNFQFQTDSNGFYMGFVPLSYIEPISIYAIQQTGEFFSVPPFYSYYGYYGSNGPGYSEYYFTQTGQRQCGFDFGLLSEVSLIKGTVYADTNHNGQQDPGEPGIANQTVTIGNESVVTFSDGSYYAYIDSGSYLLFKDSSGFFSGDAVLPPSINLNIQATSVTDSGENFGIEVPAGVHDLALDLIPTSPVSPGLESYYWLLVTNLSGHPETFSDSITADPSLSFDPQTTYGAQIDPATNTANWSGFQIPAFQSYQQYYVGCIASSSLNYNQDIYNSAAVSITGFADANPGNNRDSVHQVVVASFDPNNKQANQAGRSALGYISTGQVLKYTVEFQNTGNADAINITIRDIIDPGFDIHSFRFIAATANCDIKITGDTVYFRLLNIMLPPDTLVGPGPSTGWVSYSIQPKSTLDPLTELHNTASVFFDHNLPIITNTTLHTIEPLTGIISDGYDDGQLIIAPNPFTRQTHFRLQNMPGLSYQYMVTDILGRNVIKGIIKTGEVATLYRNAMSAGTYLLTIYDENGIAKRVKIEAQ